MGAGDRTRGVTGDRIQPTDQDLPAGQCLAEYPLPPDGVKNEHFSPEGLPAPARSASTAISPPEEEEKRLRAIAPAVSVYVDFSCETQGMYRHELLRRLLALSRKMSLELLHPDP